MFDPEEQAAFDSVVANFANYRNGTLRLPKVKRIHAEKLPAHHQKYLKDHYNMLSIVEDRIIRNQIFLKHIIADYPIIEKDVGFANLDKIRTVLKQFVRDWSDQGQQERLDCYAPILQELDSIFNSKSREERGKLNILVPGAGLARLAHDIATLGFSVQGNEFSFYMLLSSNFILNQVDKTYQFDIFPWVHSFSNHLSKDSIIEPVKIPDIVPGKDIPSTSEFSMAGGDFIQVYSDSNQENKWDAVVTCFFLDTASNIIEYIEIIHKMLKKGGIWINLGPLLYHFEDGHDPSIELPLDQVLKIVKSIGFNVTKSCFKKCTYTNHPDTLLSYNYNCVFWVSSKI